MFREDNQPPKYLAYIEWFELDPDPKPNHLLYCVRRSFDKNNKQLASVIPLDQIRRSIHLLPAFGEKAPLEWSADNVLEKCDTF